jgi:DNA ligase (NAD+)
MHDLVHTPADIYKLGMSSLVNLERMAENPRQNLLAAIDKSRDTTLARFIFGLGIRNVGETTAKDLARISADLSSDQADESGIARRCRMSGRWWPSASLDFFAEPHNREVISGAVRGDALAEGAAA